MKKLYSGKAKTVYDAGNDEVLIVYRDDITAFDSQKHDVIKGKGFYNCNISSRFFKYLEHNGIKTHFIRQEDDVSIRAKKVNIIPLEVIVRNIAAGSITRNYPIKEKTVFDKPIVMFDYKDDEYHDPLLNEDIAVAMGITTLDEMQRIRKISLEINNFLQVFLSKYDILLPDFKLEFGKTSKGELILADEISPDTCRFWDKKTMKSLDKDNYRFDKGDVLSSYKIIYDIVREGIDG